MNNKKRFIYKDCNKYTKNHQQRTDNLGIKFDFSPYYVIAWIGHLVYLGAVKVSSSKVYQKQPYGITILVLQNSMNRNAFIFMR